MRNSEVYFETETWLHVEYFHSKKNVIQSITVVPVTGVSRYGYLTEREGKEIQLNIAAKMIVDAGKKHG